MAGLRRITAAFVALLGLALATDAEAQLATGQATVYEIRMVDAAFCTDALCLGETSIGSGELVVDIASANAGATIGSFGDFSLLPAGQIFTHTKVTLSRTININGTLVDAGNLGAIAANTCRTDTANDGGAAGAGAVAADGAEGAGAASTQALFVPTPLSFAGGTLPTTASYTAAGIQLPMGATQFEFIFPLAAPFTVGTELPVFTLSFDTLNALGGFAVGAACQMVPQPPGVNLAIGGG